MAGLKVGTAAAHFAAPCVLFGEVESLATYGGREIAVVTWVQDGKVRRMTVLSEQLVPLEQRGWFDPAVTAEEA